MIESQALIEGLPVTVLIMTAVTLAAVRQLTLLIALVVALRGTGRGTRRRIFVAYARATAGRRRGRVTHRAAP